MSAATKKKPYPATSPAARALNVLGDKWTLLIVQTIRDAGGELRFVEVQRRTLGISTEQLRVRLNAMVADGLLRRTRHREVPPRVMYELTPKGVGAVVVLDELRVWAERWSP